MQKILVIKHGSLGDWITMTGGFKLIREKHPNDSITLLTHHNFEKFAIDTNWFNEIWIDNRKSFLSPKTWQILCKIKKKQFDIVYDLQCSGRTEWYRKLLKTKKIIWHARTADSEANYQGLPTPHILVRIHRRLTAADIRTFPTPDISWLKEPITQFDMPQKYIVVIPGCSKLHANVRRWTPEGYAAFIEAMNQKNLSCVLIGASDDQDIIEKITALTKTNNIINLINRCTLGMIAELCRHAVAAFGSDTGTMHIAGLCCPSLALFSSFANPETNKSGGKNVHTLQVDNLKTLEAKTVIDLFEKKILTL